MTLKTYHPEMGEAKPQAQMEASMSYNGKYYYIYTPLTLKTGRSVKHLGVYKSSELVNTPQAQRKVGWNKYQVTRKEFPFICAQYNVSYEILLD